MARSVKRTMEYFNPVSKKIDIGLFYFARVGLADGFVLWLGISRHSACLAAPPYCAPSVILRGAKRSRRICWWVFARRWLAGWYTPSGYAGSACGQTAKCRSGCSNLPEVTLCAGEVAARRWRAAVAHILCKVHLHHTVILRGTKWSRRIH